MTYLCCFLLDAVRAFGRCPGRSPLWVVRHQVRPSCSCAAYVLKRCSLLNAVSALEQGLVEGLLCVVHDGVRPPCSCAALCWTLSVCSGAAQVEDDSGFFNTECGSLIRALLLNGRCPCVRVLSRSKVIRWSFTIKCDTCSSAASCPCVRALTRSTMVKGRSLPISSRGVCRLSLAMG